MAYTKYYRAQLSRAVQPLYDVLLRALMQFEHTVHLPAVSVQDVNRLLTALDYDNPELFHVEFNHITFTCIGQEMIVHPRYAYTCTQVQALRAQINARAYAILAQAEHLAAVQKELYLHDYLIHHGTYGTTPGREREAHNLIGAMLDGKCVCEGFAKAFKYLCDLARVPAILAVGKVNDGDGEEWHAWNIVRIDGRAYHVDVTHDLVREYRYASRAHFNLSDSEMLSNRRPRDVFPLPACPESGAVIPLIGSKAQLLDHLRQEALLGKARTEVRLTRGFTMEQIQQIIFNGPAAYDLWASQMAGLRYGEGKRSVIIQWKEPTALRHAAARASNAMHNLLHSKRPERASRAGG